jgi:mannose-6-phosphate isomerase-like protein (cupin superfamily)
MSEGEWASVVGVTALDSGGSSTDRLMTETLHRADGVELVRAVLSEDARWYPREYADAAAYGYVVTGTASFSAGEPESVTERRRRDRETAASVTAAEDEFFRVPSNLVPTVECSEGTDRLEVLVGFDSRGASAPSHAADGGTVDGQTPTDAVDSADVSDAVDTTDATDPTDATDATDPTDAISVVGPDDLDQADELKSVSRKTPFPDAPIRQVRGHSEGVIVSEWHHHGDNHVFGYVLRGDGYVEWGTGEGERKLVEEDECFHIPDGFVHRDRSSSPGKQDYVLWLTGSEPRTIPVEEPKHSR